MVFLLSKYIKDIIFLKVWHFEGSLGPMYLKEVYVNFCRFYKIYLHVHLGMLHTVKDVHMWP